MHSLCEACLQDRVVLGSADGRLGSGAGIHHDPVVVRDPLDFIPFGHFYTFPDHQRTFVYSFLDGLNPLGECADVVGTCLIRDYLDLGHLAISHPDDSRREVLQADIVSHHYHRDLLAHVQVNQNLHHYISRTGVEVTCWLI